MNSGETGVRKPGGHLPVWLILSALLLAAALLRLWHLTRESLWGDEALTLIMARWPLSDLLWLPTDNTPILYYAVHKLIGLESQSLLAIRSISFVCGVAAVGLIYLLGRQCFGRKGGLIAAALLGVWAPHVTYSQEARPYSLLIMLTLASAVTLASYMADTGALSTARRRLLLAGFCLATILGFYTQMVFAFWLALSVALLAAGLLQARARQRRGEIMLALLLIGAALVPGLMRLAWQLSVHNFVWLEQAGPFQFAADLSEVVLPAGFWDNALLAGADQRRLVKGIAMLLFWPVGAGLLYHRRQRIGDYIRRHPIPSLIIAAFLALPLLLWSYGFIGTPIFMPRTILYAAPGFILLITGFLVSLPAHRGTTAVLSAVGLFLVSTLLYVSHPRKEPWRETAAYLERNVRPGDVVLLCPHTKYPALRFALRRAVAAPALVTWRDRLILVESSFGKDPLWREAFYMVERKATLERIRGEGARATLASSTLVLAPRRSLWMIDATCQAAELAPLASLFASGTLRWVSSWRSRMVGPTSFSILQLRPLQPVTLQYSSGVP